MEIALFQTTLPAASLEFLAGGRFRWLLFLGGFVVLGGIASRKAHSLRSVGGQLAALAAYVLLQALIFMPLLKLATLYADVVIESAAYVTLAGFTALTAIVLLTRKDFSFLRGVVVYGMIVALIAIVAAVIFDFQMGVWFSGAMVALAGASILYETSNILHHYPEDSYVAAALGLFASVALLFWYVLQLFLFSRE